MPKIHDTKGKQSLSRRIAQKLTLFKMKDEGRLGKTCTRCKWRKITSRFSRFCTKCSKETGKGGI